MRSRAPGLTEDLLCVQFLTPELLTTILRGENYHPCFTSEEMEAKDPIAVRSRTGFHS